MAGKNSADWLANLAKVLEESGGILEKTSRIKPYGIVKKRELFTFHGEEWWVVWDYIIWNEITLENFKTGKKVSMWQGLSDEEAQIKFDEVLSKSDK